MYNSVGITFLAGFAVMILIGSINYLLGKNNIKFQKGLMKDKDRRIKTTKEVFEHIMFTKVNAWEEHFYHKLDE